MPTLKGSWRSTAVGIAGAVGTLVICGYHWYNNRPVDEAVLYNAVVTLVLGLIVRDDGVTSEQAGAAPKKEQP